MARRFAENLRWGVIAGLFFACFYSLYVIGLYLIRGSTPFVANDTTFGQVVASYFGTGIVAGAVVGLLRPLLRWRIGAVFVGIVAAFAVFVGIALLDQGSFSQWDQDTWVSCVSLAVLFGTFGALIRWHRSRSHQL